MWDLLLSDEQAMIADAVSQFLAAELPIDRLRPNAALRDAGVAWGVMAELGWFGIGIAERDGGLGLGLVEEMLVQLGCGRHLASPTILATVLASHVARAAGQRSLVEALVSGDRRAALALAARAQTGAKYELLVFDWSDGDLLLYWNESGAGLFAPEAFCSPRVDECLDDSLTLHCGSVTLGDALCWVSSDEAPIGLRGEALLAARLVGLAEGASALAAGYAKVREQFGTPIGAFQAIKHRCADMFARAQTSGYLTGLACLKLDVGAADAPLQVAAAKLKAAYAAHENGRGVIQVHGGLGYQTECDAHWFMKRAHIYDQVGGNMQLQAKRVFAAPSPLWG